MTADVGQPPPEFSGHQPEFSPETNFGSSANFAEIGCTVGLIWVFHFSFCCRCVKICTVSYVFRGDKVTENNFVQLARWSFSAHDLEPLRGPKTTAQQVVFILFYFISRQPLRETYGFQSQMAPSRIDAFGAYWKTRSADLPGWRVTRTTLIISHGAAEFLPLRHVPGVTFYRPTT